MNISLDEMLRMDIGSHESVACEGERLLAADSRKFKYLRPQDNLHRKKSDIFDVEDLDLSHMSEKRRSELKRMLEDFQSIWDGHLGEIYIIKHRIELLPGTRPIRQP